ncbi:MAG: Smr/MutS family protein [Pseudomonadota bacterium]
MKSRTDPPEAPSPDEDDAALFRAAIGPVRTLPSVPEGPEKPRPRPETRMRDRDEDDARSEFRRALDASPLLAGDTLSYRRDEVPQRVLQRLARGQYAAQDEIDLHSADAAQAEALVRRFLREATETGMGCVRIVHGKGLRAADGVPTLKNAVDRLLRQRADVLAFHSAPPAQGGTGAVLVLLTKR